MKKLLPVLVVLELFSLGLGLLIPSLVEAMKTTAISFAVFYVAATVYLSKDSI